MVADEVCSRHHLDAVEPGRRVRRPRRAAPAPGRNRAAARRCRRRTARPGPARSSTPSPTPRVRRRPGPPSPPAAPPRRRRCATAGPTSRREELVDRRTGLHRLVGHLRVGVGGEAEQPGPLRPQRGDLDHQRAVVVLTGVGPVDGRLEQPPPDVPVAQHLQRRLTGGQDQGDGPLAVVPPRGGGIGGGRDRIGGSVRRVRSPGVQQHGRILAGLQQVLRNRVDRVDSRRFSSASRARPSSSSPAPASTKSRW